MANMTGKENIEYGVILPKYDNDLVYYKDLFIHVIIDKELDSVHMYDRNCDFRDIETEGFELTNTNTKKIYDYDPEKEDLLKEMLKDNTRLLYIFDSELKALKFKIENLLLLRDVFIKRQEQRIKHFNNKVPEDMIYTYHLLQNNNPEIFI